MPCSLCDDDAGTACIDRILIFNDKEGTNDKTSLQLEPIPYGSEPMYDDWIPSNRCAKCGVVVGEYHHDGCGFEICPHCGGQLNECSCQPGVIARGFEPA